MRLTRLSLRNILGIESLDIEPGKITVISGPNGSGKTSIVEAIKSFFARGTDPSLRHVGAEKGEAVAEITDGAVKHQVRRSITEKGDYLTVDGRPGKEWLRELVAAARLNPVSLLSAPPRDRLATLLRACNVEFPRGPLREAVRPALDAAATPASLTEQLRRARDGAPDAFAAIEAVREVLYAHRTGVNRALKEAATVAATLAEALPAGGSLEEVERVLGEARAQLRAVEDAVVKKRASATLRYADLREQARAKRDAALNAAYAQYERDHNEINAREREELAAITEGGRGPSLVRGDEVARLSAERDQLLRAETTRKHADEARERATALTTEAEGCTTSLDAIDKVKASLVESLPIPGVEIKEGEIYVGGVPFDRLNTQQRIDIAVMIAEKLPSQLDLCVVDGIEVLDAEHRAAFIERAKASPLQFIVTAVADGDLRVEVSQ